MKAIAASLATAALLSGGAYATNITPMQFSKLSARVAKLEAANTQLTTYVSECLHAFKPIAEFGDATLHQGYLFHAPDGSTGDTSALDFVGPADKVIPDIWVAGADHDCGGAKP